MHRLAVLEMMLDGQFEGKIYILQEDVTDDVVYWLRQSKSLNTASDTVIKICPFCAGEGKVIHQRWSNKDFYGVICNGECGTFFDCRASNEADAIKEWNKRVINRS